MNPLMYQAVTVTLNPAIDQTITVPNFKAGAVNRVQHVRSNPGGKGVNVASALADYGLAVAATGFLGRENPAVFVELFTRKKIADHFIRIAGQTRVGIKISDPARGETTDINFPGAAPTQEDKEGLRSRIADLAALNPTWFVLTGSLPPGVDPAIYADITKALRARGHTVALDTSGEALQMAIEAVPDIIKPNIHELEALTGRELKNRAAITDAARSLIARGTSLIAVSMGADGALFVSAEEVVMAIPPDIEIRSTVGAGDAMVAGIIAGTLRHLPLADCARLATAFSLDALARGESGVSSHAAIEAAMANVRIEPG